MQNHYFLAEEQKKHWKDTGFNDVEEENEEKE